MAAVGKLVGDTEIARCEAGKPAVIKVKSELWQIPPPSVKDLELLTPVANGCKSLSTKEECLNSKDASVAKLDSFKVYGEACIWCGGIAHGQGLAFDVFHAKHSFEVAGKSSSIKHANWNGDCLEKAVKGCPSLQDEYSCLASVDDRDEDPYHKGLKARDEAQCSTASLHFGELSCLKEAKSGCNEISDKDTCLASVDGRPYAQVGGYKVKGQPCVWCGGLPCQSGSLNTNKCEPYDFAGNTFNTFTASGSHKVAQCWHLPQPKLELSCLREHKEGCHTLKEATQCLSSFDGRAYERVAGFKVKGQPCVWCGGQACHGNNGNLCEPLDFALNGNGYAFDAVAPDSSKTMAGCQSGHSVSLPLPPRSDVIDLEKERAITFHTFSRAGAEAARLAAEKGMSQEQQVREAAMAIGKLAKAEGLSAQSAAQIAAAGAQEAAKKNGDSQLKQQELAIMAAALAATEAAQDSMPAEQKAAEIGLAVAESASAAGMSFEQQMEAASTAIGTFAADSGLSPQQAAKIAADGSRRAAKAANKDENQVAASAAAVAAAKAAGAGGKHGQELALIIAGAAAAASPGISPEEQFQVVRSALGDNAATVGLTPAELDAIAHQAVPAAKTAASPDATDPMAAGKAAASRVQSDKGTPYEEAMAAGQAAYKAAVAKPGVSVAEEVSSAHDASKKAALAAGVTAAEAETLAGAVANAVSGGAKEEIDTNVVTISPSEAAAATASQPAAESLEETPAERDAAEAGAEAARLAAAGGKSAQEQMDDAAVAAGRAAINGHMTPVGAVEAARKAATLAGINAGLSATEAARLGTEAAERAEVSGAFTAPNWRSIATTPTTTPTTTTSSEENSTVAVVMAGAGASSAGVAVAADSGNETIVVLTEP
eukprot:g17505.t1